MMTTPSASSDKRLDISYALLCAAVAALSILFTLPFAEVSLNDDWSFAYTTKIFAETGRFTFNGWSTALLGVQAIWGAMWIKLFGFSFTVLRLSTLPISAGAAVLLYALHRHAGLRPSLSLFGTLFVLLSPIYLPVAASFMSDVPGFFLFLSILLLYVRAVPKNEGEGSFSANYLIAGTIVAAAGGTVRQLLWPLPVLLLPVIAYQMRTRRGYALCAALTALNIAFMAWCLWWLQQQPYLVQDNVGSFLRVAARHPGETYENSLHYALHFVLLILPILLGTPLLSRSAGFLSRRGPGVALGLLLGWLCFFAFLPNHLPHGVGRLVYWRQLFSAPYWHMGNIVTTKGVLGGGSPLGERPAPLPHSVWMIFSALVAFVICAGALALWRSERERARTKTRLIPFLRTHTNALFPARRAQCLLLYLTIATVMMTLLSFPRMFIGLAFDRYFINNFPLVTILFLADCQRRGGVDFLRIGGAMIALFGLYAVAITHDYSAVAGASATAAERLVARGVPRAQICAGFEYDCWTQILIRQHINEPRIKIPPGSFIKPEPRLLPLTMIPYWLRATPDVQPRYFISASALPLAKDTDFAPVPYQLWLPYSAQKMVIEEMPDHLTIPPLPPPPPIVPDSEER